MEKTVPAAIVVACQTDVFVARPALEEVRMALATFGSWADPVLACRSPTTGGVVDCVAGKRGASVIG